MPDRCVAVLRLGGILYLTTPNFNSLNRALLGSSWGVFDPGHLQYFSARSLRLALTRVGFKDCQIASKNFNPVEVFEPLGLTEGSGSSRTTTGALRQAVETRRPLRVTKRLVNAVFRSIPLGDTLYVMARKA